MGGEQAQVDAQLLFRNGAVTMATGQNGRRNDAVGADRIGGTGDHGHGAGRGAARGRRVRRQCARGEPAADDRIGPFDGAYGGTLADAIERRLSKLGADGVPHAVLVPAGLRPDGLLSGHTGVDVSSNDYTESRERCVEKNKDGNASPAAL